MNLNIKKIKESDTNLLKKIASIEKLEFSEPLSEKTLTDCTSTDRYRIYALTENHQLLAYIVLCLCDTEAQILSIASIEKRKGFMESLFKKCIKELKIFGVKRIHLEVRKSNTAAIRLYKKLGFCLSGCRKNLYTKPVEDGYIMYLETKNYADIRY